MTIEIKGTVKVLNATEQVTEKFAKREVVVTIDETSNYPQHISIQANNDKIALLDSVEVGDSVTIVANLNGRESKGRYYNSLTIFKLTKEQSSPF
jgi:ribosomal 30S subunit maturation factor RimM